MFYFSVCVSGENIYFDAGETLESGCINSGEKAEAYVARSGEQT